MAQYADSDYDSDAEASRVAPSAPDPFATAGKRSIAQLLAHPETRLTSKVAVKNLKQGGTWAEQWICALWANRFQAWRVGTLRVDPDSVPSGEQVCRFIAAFIEVYASEVAPFKGTLAYDTMDHAVKKLKKAVAFKYEHFNLSQHWKLKINALLQNSVDTGSLTRAAKKSREPAGAVVMRRVITALYQDAISNGTGGWNTTLSDIAALLLLTCLGVRVGDIMGSTNDVRPDLPGLRYGDVQLLVVDDTIKGRFLIRSAKGMKVDGKRSFHIRRDALSEGADNILDPINIMLILAMRSGNVEELSLEDILDKAAARSDHTIRWKDDDRPVLCAVINDGIDFTRLASKQRANRTLAKAMRIMGLHGRDAKVSPHQMRYGMASDMVLTSSTQQGHSKDQIADALAHSMRARARNTVVGYTGAFTGEDTWAARVNLTANQDGFSRLVGLTNPAQKRKQPDDDESKVARPSKSAFRPVNPEQEFDEDEDLGYDLDEINCTELDGGARDAECLDILSEDVPLVTPGRCTGTLKDALSASRSIFVDTFSTINLTRAPAKGGAYLDYARRTGLDKKNSVEGLSRFLYDCPNAANGCTYAGAKDVDLLSSHVLTCKFDKPSGKVRTARKTTKAYACTVGSCTKAYNDQRELDTHHREIHQPIRCFVAQCKDNKAYVGQKALLGHVRLAHPASGLLHSTVPDQTDALFPCAYESCPEEFHYFISGSFTARKYLKHLSDEHGISDKTEWDKLVPKFPGNPCFFPTCGSKELFPQDKKGREAYNEHLAADHGVEDEVEQVEYSWARVRGLVLPMRPQVVPETTSQRVRRIVQEESDGE